MSFKVGDIVKRGAAIGVIAVDNGGSLCRYLVCGNGWNWENAYCAGLAFPYQHNGSGEWTDDEGFCLCSNSEALAFQREYPNANCYHKPKKKYKIILGD